MEISFENDTCMQKTRDVALLEFMNKSEYTAHYIACYCDNYLRKGLKGVS